MKAGDQRMADVRHPFEVECPARLLVEMGTRELPQDGSIHQEAPFPRPRGAGRPFTYILVSSRLQDCQLKCALDTLAAVRTFSSSSCSHVWVTDTRLCRWPWTSRRSPLIVRPLLPSFRPMGLRILRVDLPDSLSEIC